MFVLIIATVGLAFCINNGNILTSHCAVLDLPDVNKASSHLLWGYVFTDLYGGPNVLSRHSSTRWVRQSSGKTQAQPQTLPRGKAGPTLTSWPLGHAPWPHVALRHHSVKGYPDTLWRTAPICSAPSRLSDLLVRQVQVWGKAVDSASPDQLVSSFPGRNEPPRTRKNWLDGGKHGEQVDSVHPEFFWKDVQCIRG